MGIAGIGVWQLVIIAAIALLLFGSGRLRSIGGDLGTAIRGFKDSLREDPAAAEVSAAEDAEVHR